jgi:hypothetical protein
MIIVLFAVSLVTSSFATPAHVHFERFEAVRGLSVNAYFVTNPITDSPITVQTTQYMHGSSGFFIIPKEHSAHLSSTQFSTAVVIPAGWMVMDFWAQPTAAGGPGLDAALLVSAYTTDSQGTIQNTLFENQVTESLFEEGGQLVSVFEVASGYVPALGYLEVVLTAPESSAIKVFWGNDYPSNFQVIFSYG